MKESTVPVFERRGIAWRCWIDGDGCYVWRSECGRMAVRRVGRECQARVGTEVLSREFGSLREAMDAAARISEMAA